MIINGRQSVWKEHLNHLVLTALDIANNPGKNPLPYFSPQAFNIDAGSSARMSCSSPEVDFDEVPAARLLPRDDRP
jgi:hypothetical protein